MNGNVYNKLTVFQTEQKGKDIKRVASIPVQRLKVNGSLMISCLGYDQKLDVLRIVSSDLSDGANGLVEMRLKREVLKCGTSQVKIPSFVQKKRLPADMDVVKAIHISSECNAFFLCDQEYYVLNARNDRNGDPCFSKARHYSEVTGDNDFGEFNGFQPTLSPDTYLILKGRSIYPVKFEGQSIRLDEQREIVRQDRRINGSLWAVKEIEEDKLAVGYFVGSELNIYVDRVLKRSIDIRMERTPFFMDD